MNPVKDTLLNNKPHMDCSITYLLPDILLLTGGNLVVSCF